MNKMFINFSNKRNPSCDEVAGSSCVQITFEKQPKYAIN